jgi:hypothetical protein
VSAAGERHRCQSPAWVIKLTERTKASGPFDVQDGSRVWTPS